MEQALAPAREDDRLEPARKVRAELNLEQWSIWQPSNSNRAPKPRVLRKEITTPNGDRLTAEVEIAASRKGTLTTEDQKTYYALVEHYQRNSRKTDDIVYFSLRSLAKSLAKKWGSRTIETLTDSLTRLRANTLVWRNSYHNSDTGRKDETLDFFNIITDLKIVTSKEGGHTTRAEGYFKLNDAIIANLERNYSKPVLLDVVLSFKSEVAQILYTQLDRILSRDITVYQKRTKDLFEDLGLEGKKYAYPAGRKQLLEPTIEELVNAPLSNGKTIASVVLEKTADGKDYNLVAKRGRAKPQKAATEPRSGEREETARSKENRPSERQIEAKAEVSEAKQEGSELIAYFLQVFFGADNPTIPPTKKHYELATVIVANHGEAVSRYIVDFAKREAAKTNFQIATFGAIANYVDRAVADYTRHQAEQKRIAEAKRQEAKREAEERAFQESKELGIRLYNALTDEERTRLTDDYKAELLASEEWQNRDLTTPTGQTILEMAVKSAIRQYLVEQHQKAFVRET